MGNDIKNTPVNYEGMIIIQGDLFQFDQSRTRISLYDNPSHFLTFENLDRGFGSYMGGYNPEKRDFVDVPEYLAGKGNILATNIPIKVVDTGDTLSENEIREYNEVSLINGQGFYLVDRELSDRLNGILPQIKIDDLHYSIDIGKREIRQVENPEKKFMFRHQDLFEHSEMFYNTVTKSPVVLSQETTSIPADVVCIRFPRWNELDLVGYTELSQLPGTTLVTQLPWRPAAEKVQMVNASQSVLAEQIKKKRQEKQGQDDKQQKRKGKRSSKRL